MRLGNHRRGWMLGKTVLALCAVLPLVAVPPAGAQDAPSGAQAGSGGRGGRRGGAGAGDSMRVFLGLGPAPDAAAAKKGEPLYKENCATCHGESAHGAQGPNLVRSVVVLHDEKGEEIGPVVRGGRPQAGMPAFPEPERGRRLQHRGVSSSAGGTGGQPRHLWRHLRRPARTRPAGMPNRARHSSTARAGAPSAIRPRGDMAKIGAKYPQAAALQARFLWPAQRGPAQGQGDHGLRGNRRRRRPKPEGFRCILDGRGAASTISGRATRCKVEIEDQIGRTSGSAAAKYTDADIHDLTAYLETLK